MKFWEVKYTRSTKHFTDQWVTYYHSTTPITINTIIMFWDIVNPGYSTISDFSCKEITQDPDKKYTMHITESI
jgi:hypothetical protein